MRLKKITIHREMDEYADCSWLGKYTDDLRTGVYVCALGEFYERLPAGMERDTDGRFYRKGEPDVPPRGREYRGIIPYAGGVATGTKDYYKYGRQDAERLESLSRGDWYFLYVYAEAKVEVCGTVQRIRTPGVGGVESDCPEYLAEVEGEELAELRKLLLEMGVNLSQWDTLEICHE